MWSLGYLRIFQPKGDCRPGQGLYAFKPLSPPSTADWP